MCVADISQRVCIEDNEVSKLPGFDSAGALTRAVTPREHEFLELGSALQQSAEQIEELMEQAGFLVGLTSRESLDSFGHELSAELARMQSLYDLAAGAENEAALDGILSTLAGLTTQLERFKRIVKHLTMLGISTRIESARLGADGKGFGTLADDVEKLAVAIDRQSDAIQEQCSALDGLVLQALEQARAMLRTQEMSSRQVVASVERNVSSMVETAEASQHVSKAVESESRETYRHISQAVSSLQFHDITRQQVEHVEEAVTDALALIEEHLQHTSPEAESDAELVGFLYDLATLESRQLVAAQNRFVQAVEDLQGQLQGVGRAMASLAQDVNALGQGNGGSGALDAIERTIGEMMQAMQRFAEQGTSMGAVMEDVIATIAAMGEFLEGVEEVGASIELIALNASVKAAHTGEKGAAMGVLAQSIQTLAHDARHETEAISTALADIGSASDILHKNTQRFREGVRVEETMDRLGVLVNGLKEVDAETTSLFQEVTGNAMAVSEHMHALAAGLQMHHEVAASLSEGAAAMDAVAAQAATLVPTTGERTHTARLDQLLNRYTMEIERQIHMDDGLGAEAPSPQHALHSEDGEEADPLDGVEFF